MPYYNGKYITDSEVQKISAQLCGDELEEFRESLSSSRSGGLVESAVIGAATGSAIIGGVLGGSFLGGLVGDELSDRDY